MTLRAPARAKVEFEGDCFGRLYKVSATECENCLVRKQCKAKTVFARAREESTEHEETKESEEIVEKNGKKVKPDKAYQKDKKNAGLRPGSFKWACYQVLRGAVSKKFSLKEFETKVKGFCLAKEVRKSYGLKYKPDSVPLIVGVFKRSGYIQKIGKEKYKKLIS